MKRIFIITMYYGIGPGPTHGYYWILGIHVQRILTVDYTFNLVYSRFQPIYLSLKIKAEMIIKFVRLTYVLIQVVYIWVVFTD